MKRRARKVASTLHSRVAELLLSEVRDPRLEGVAVTDVEVQDDLRKAYVYFKIVGETPENKVLYTAFKKVTPFLKSRLSEQMGLRFTPDLEFRHDAHQEKLTRILGLIDEIHTEGID